MRQNFSITGYSAVDEVVNRADNTPDRIGHDLIKATGFEVWTGAGKTGTQLVIDTHFSLTVKDTKRSDRAGFDIFTLFAVTDPTYYDTDLYLTYTYHGDYLSVENMTELFNDIIPEERIPTLAEKAAMAGTEGTPDASNPFVTNEDTRLALVPSTGEKAALAGTSGTPGTDNKYVTNADERLPTVNQKEAMMGSYGSPSGTNRFVTEEDPILGTGGESIDPMLHFVKKATGSAIPGRFATLPGTNDIASVENDGYNDKLYLYRRTGDTWSLVGTPYQFLHSSGFVYLTGVSATQVAVIDTISDTIHLYGHVNGVWSEAGGWISFQGSNFLSISGSATNRVVMGRVGGVYKYSYYSSQWHYLGGTHLDPGESTEVSVAEISSTDVAVTCTQGVLGDDFLARYTWNEETDEYDIVGTPYVFDPQPIAARMTVNKGPGDSVFLQVWDGATGGLGYYTAQFTWTGSTYAPIPGALPGSSNIYATVAYTSGTELLVYDGTNIAPYSFGMDVVNHRTTFLVSSGAMTAPDLPIGRGIVLMKDSAYDGNPVTISTPSGADFEGLSSLELYGQYSYVELERISSTVFAVKEFRDAFDFTPEINFSTLNEGIVYTTQLGKLERSKNTETISIFVAASKGTSTGNLNVTVPTIRANTLSQGTMATINITGTNDIVKVISSAGVLNFYKVPSGAVTEANLPSVGTFTIRGSFSYNR